MKIAVCVKAVPGDSAERQIDATSGRLGRAFELTVAPDDLCAVEEALRVRERLGVGEVVVLSLGPPHAAHALRRTLAMGADRLVLLADEAFEGADLLTTAAALAAVLRIEQPELTLFGPRSPDGDGGCLGAAIAEHLQQPLLTQVSELSADADAIEVGRQTERGAERLTAPLPAVVAVTESINRPRFPSLEGVVRANTTAPQRISAAELGGVASARTTVLSLAPPRQSERQVKTDDGTAAEAIVEFLSARGLLR